VPDACSGLTMPATAFWLVCLIVFIDSLGGSISAPVLPFYANEFHCSTADIGVLFSAFSLAQVVFLPVLGKLSDKFGRRTVLVGSLFGAAIGALGQGLAPTYWVLVAARVISGGCGAVGSTANVYVSDITTEAMRGQYLGYLMNSNGAAFAFGPGLGGGLSRLGLNVPIEVNGALCLVAGLLSLVYLPESPVFVRHQQEVARFGTQDSTSPTQTQRFPAEVWAVCGVEFLRGMSFSAIFALYGLFALKVYGLDSLHIGYAVCIGALTLICTNVWLTGPLQRMMGQIGSAACGTAIMALGELALAYAPNFALSLLGMWSVYMGQAIAGSNIAAVTSLLATDENRGEVMSMQQMAQAMGRVVGPVWLGSLSDIDQRLPFAIAASCIALAALVLLSLRTAYQRKLSVDDLQEALLPSPRPEPEAYTQDDVHELGTFLCELLTEGGYRWHEEECRDSLKKALACYFPPLGADQQDEGRLRLPSEHGASLLPATADAHQLQTPKISVQPPPKPSPNPLGPVTSMGAEVTFTGDDSNFLRSPQLGRRPYMRTARPAPSQARRGSA